MRADVRLGSGDVTWPGVGIIRYASAISSGHRGWMRSTHSLE